MEFETLVEAYLKARHAWEWDFHKLPSVIATYMNAGCDVRDYLLQHGGGSLTYKGVTYRVFEDGMTETEED